MTGTKRSTATSEGQLPIRLSPMLARPTAAPFDSPDYAFEIKWDGTRCIAFVESHRLRLQNRRFIEMSSRYPELDGLRRLPVGTVLDGEIVVLVEGKPSFRTLQQREHLQSPERIALASRRLPATLMAFDLLYENGLPIMSHPFTERRKRLTALVNSLHDPHLVLSEAIPQHGLHYFKQVEQHGLEGVIAKQTDSPYLPGRRAPYWLKIKVGHTTEFSILGFTPGEVKGQIGALLLGEPSGHGWVFRGKVGTGFTEEQRQQFFHQLSQAPKLANPPSQKAPRQAVWRAHGDSCLVRYTEMTAEGKLRAPVFLKQLSKRS